MSGVHVASMLHRGFGTVWKWLEMLGSSCTNMRPSPVSRKWPYHFELAGLFVGAGDGDQNGRPVAWEATALPLSYPPAGNSLIMAGRRRKATLHGALMQPGLAHGRCRAVNSGLEAIRNGRHRTPCAA